VADVKSTVRIANNSYVVEVERKAGRLVRLQDRIGGYELITEPRLADNFRLLLPLGNFECNYIFGSRQRLTSFEKTETGLVLYWRGPLRNVAGRFDLDVTLSIELVDDSIQFRCGVVNRTRYQLAEVWYAMLGGMTGIGRNDQERRTTEAMIPNSSRKWHQRLFSDFGNTKGQALGTLGGEHSFMYPGGMAMPWISLYNPRLGRAIYGAALEETPRVKLVNFALMPGLAEQRSSGNWPRREETGRFPRGLTLWWAHVPYTKPGSTFESAPVVIRCHEGDWHEAADTYGKWFRNHYPVLPAGSTWIRRKTTTLHTMFMLPEDNINQRYADIPRWAKAAKAAGVGHVMLAGWQVGGHDRGYPYYAPDPRLGTWKELEDGIKACHRLGLKVSFFVNCQPIDMTTPWYKRELYKYRILDPHGVQQFIVNYWGMGTLSARNRFFTATPFSEMNPAHPEVRKLLIRQFRKLVEIGADGIHLDKFFQTPMDFNPRLKGTSPDVAHHEGILRFVDELVVTCKAINPEFCFSYEGGWDRLFPYADTLWWGAGEDSLLKAVFPHMTMIAGVEQPYDFNKVNLALLQGNHLLVGPANYTRGMDYPPMRRIASYIREVARIRESALDVLSLGEKLDASEGIFSRRQPLVHMRVPQAAQTSVRWSVLRCVKSGRRGVILVNLGLSPVRISKLALEGSRRCDILQPFRKVRKSHFPASLVLPAEQAAFVVEEGVR